jgi:phage shock protein E
MGLFSNLWSTKAAPLPDGACIIDVRSAAEYASGHIPGALNLPLDQFTASILAVVPDKQQPVILCCLSGGRSGNALQQMKQLGYTQVHNGGGTNALALQLNVELVRS